MIKFNNSFLFLLFLILPIFFLLKKFRILKTPALNLNLLNWNGVQFKIKNFIKFYTFLFWSFIFFGISTMIIALAEPVIFKTEQIYTGQGSSIMFLIDISPSMGAKDIDGDTRLNSAKKIIQKFVHSYPGDSFGLSALGSTASLIVPPTIDHKVFLARLSSLSAGELGEGTAIGMGLAVSTVYLMQKKNNPAYIILMTNGENNTGEIHPKTAAELLVEKNISFFVIGIGKTGYTELEYIDKKTGKLYSGNIDSKFNPNELKKIARYGNGKYASAKSSQILEEIFAEISKKIPAQQSTFTKAIEKKLYRIFLLISSICFILAWIIKTFFMRLIL